METILGLSYIAILPVITTILLYWLSKKSAFSKLRNSYKQLIYGIVFGGLAVIGSEYGVDVGGAMANTRAASVLSASLVFGGPAGIIAGAIGGVERFLCVYWGGGYYTRYACSLSTLLAGLFGAVLRKYMLDSKKPSALHALAIGLSTEVLHMMMIFFTNMSDIATAFVFVQKCAVPMITVNGLAVMLSVLAVSRMSKERIVMRRYLRRISSIAQRWLVGCVLVAFLMSCGFTYILQTQISSSSTESLLRLNIDDIVADISDASGRNLLRLANLVSDRLARSNDLNGIAKEYKLSEINIVSADGIITGSTKQQYIGFDMSQGKQSAEFLCLLSEKKEYVQDYQPISFDNTVSMKYAGVALARGGFLQVGYDAANFQRDIAKEVESAAENRRVGQSGYLLIADAHNRIVSGNRMGETLREAGIQPQHTQKEDVIFRAQLFGAESFCMLRRSEGYSILSVLPASEADFARSLSIYVTVFMEIVIFVAQFILIYFLIKRLVLDNIKSVNKSLGQITGGNLNVTVNVRSNEEFASLSDDINATVDTLKAYIAEAAARIDRELELAKVIQESSLPSVFPPFPERQELDIYASMHAAREVGGDFYDFYLLDEDHLAFLVADVSGKGITAAMFMMKAKALIKGFAEQGGSAADILTRANAALCEGNDAEMFVTCWMGILDLKQNKLEFANAGHNPPLVRRKDGSFEYFRAAPGFVLAGMEGVRYRRGEMDFAPGDAIFLYTDGVTEATDAGDRLYGEGRLHETLNALDSCAAEEICSHVKASMDEFVSAAPQFDDITMLCIRFCEG